MYIIFLREYISLERGHAPFLVTGILSKDARKWQTHLTKSNTPELVKKAIFKLTGKEFDSSFTNRRFS